MSPLDEALKNSREGRPDESEKILRSLDQANPRVLFNLGWHDIRHGDLKKGMRGLNQGRMINVFGSPPLPGKLWNKEPLQGKTLLINGEGGLGDEIINFRFCEAFKALGANVILVCSKSLAPILSRHGVPCVDSSAVQSVYYDYWLPAMSLPYCLGLDHEDLPSNPYLNATPSLPASNRKRVGIRWGGNVNNTDVEGQRKLPYEELKSMIRGYPSIDFYSFQRDNDLHLDFPGKDLAGHMTDWETTASLISSMDLMITSCTSVAHLSAAMGVPTWILTPIMPYYTWAIPGSKSPWYDSVMLFRQESPKSWTEPLWEVKNCLDSFLEQELAA